MKQDQNTEVHLVLIEGGPTAEVSYIWTNQNPPVYLGVHLDP